MKYVLLFLVLSVTCNLQAQRSTIDYTNYEVVEVTPAYGFYYKLQAPIATTTTKKIYPIQVLLENRSAAPIKEKAFYLHLLQDGKEVVLSIPKQNLPIGTAKSYTVVVEAEQRPVVVWGECLEGS